jgi:hypothetical protein
MKKSVYTYSDSSGIELELMLDANRELTDVDKNNILMHVENILISLKDEKLNLDPKVKEEAAENKRDILSLFSEQKIFVEEIDNEYMIHPYSKHYPWFVVTTSKGRIKIGWRKRVLNICWDDSIIKESAKELFPDEDVTKFDKTIHAWGYDKAKEYIDILLR